MKILFSIIINALILYWITYLLWANKIEWLGAWITLWCGNNCHSSVEALKTYFIWWIILWIINATIKPVLKILSLPLFFLFSLLTTLLINAILLKTFGYIVNDLLIIPWVKYEINWWTNFIIAVAIFTILNMFYSIIPFKK